MTNYFFNAMTLPLHTTLNEKKKNVFGYDFFFYPEFWEPFPYLNRYTLD